MAIVCGLTCDAVSRLAVVARVVAKVQPTAYCIARMVRLVLFDIDGTLIRTGGAG